MYGLGAHIARSTGLCSAGMLRRKLALSPAAADAMWAQLLQQGVISAPNTAGLAVATQPYMASVRFKAAATVAEKSTRTYMRRLAQGLEDKTRDETDRINPVEDGPSGARTCPRPSDSSA